MKNDMKDLPKRKCPRLKNYDYSSNGCYFITICTKDKKHLFGKYDVGAIHESPEKHAKNRCIELNCFGEIVKNTIIELPKHYNEVKIENYIVMPNHIHLLISINNNIDSERAIRESPLQRSLLSKVIGYLKTNSSKEIHKHNSNLCVWQRGYYDHIVRNVEDYQNCWNYIEYNVLKEYK